MNEQRSFQKGLHDSKYCHVIRSQNDLEINKIDRINRDNKGNMVIYLKSGSTIGSEVTALMHKNSLILEAPKVMDLEKPLKTHLIDQELKSNFEDAIFKIGFSEILLNRGFTYSVISCERMDNDLLKIVLKYHPDKKSEKQELN